jgi:hypothetical protein
MNQNERQRDGINTCSFTLQRSGRRMVNRLFCLLLAVAGIHVHQGLAGALPPSLDSGTKATVATAGCAINLYGGSGANCRNALLADINPVSAADATPCAGLAANPYLPDASQDTLDAYLLANDGAPSWIDYPQLGADGFVVERKDGLALPNLLAPRTRDFVMLR